MSSRAQTVSHAALIAGVLLFVGASIFFLNLGNQPIGNAEAVAAMQALPASNLDTQWRGEVGPAYAAPTAALFGLLGSSALLARLVPAIAGFCILVLPLFFRKELGWGRSLLLQAGVLLSVVVITSARTAGAGSIAVLSTLLIFGVMQTRTEYPAAGKLAAVFLGVGLCSGPVFYQGILALLLTLAVLVLIGRKQIVKKWIEDLLCTLSESWLTLLVVLLLGTEFGTNLSGLQTVFDPLGGWMRGWVEPQTSFLTAFTLLPTVEPLFLVTGTAGAILAFRKKDERGLTILGFAVAAFFCFILYPGRSGEDLLWVILPLIWLSADYVMNWIGRFEDSLPTAEYISITFSMLVLYGFSFLQFRSYQSRQAMLLDAAVSTEQILLTAVLVAAFSITMVVLYWRTARNRSWVETGVISFVILAVIAFAFLQFSSIAQSGEPGPTVEAGIELRYWAVLGAVLLSGIIVVLTGLGWSWSLADKVAGTAFLIVLTMMSISNIARLNFPGEGAPQVENFRPEATAKGMQQLEETLTSIAVRESGREDTLEIIIFGDLPPGLAWTLRGFSSPEDHTSAVPPAILFPYDRPAPALPGEYRGQTLTLFYRLSQDQDQFTDLAVVFNPLPEQEYWVLLVRNDLSTINPEVPVLDVEMELEDL